MSSAHPPKTAVVLKEAHKECVFACVSCRSEHVCMSVNLRVSRLGELSVRGARSWTLMQTASAHTHTHNPPFLKPLVSGD